MAMDGALPVSTPVAAPWPWLLVGVACASWLSATALRAARCLSGGGLPAPPGRDVVAAAAAPMSDTETPPSEELSAMLTMRRLGQLLQALEGGCCSESIQWPAVPAVSAGPAAGRGAAARCARAPALLQPAVAGAPGTLPAAPLGPCTCVEAVQKTPFPTCGYRGLLSSPRPWQLHAGGGGGGVGVPELSEQVASWLRCHAQARSMRQVCIVPQVCQGSYSGKFSYLLPHSLQPYSLHPLPSLGHSLATTHQAALCCRWPQASDCLEWGVGKSPCSAKGTIGGDGRIIVRRYAPGRLDRA